MTKKTKPQSAAADSMIEGGQDKIKSTTDVKSLLAGFAGIFWPKDLKPFPHQIEALDWLFQFKSWDFENLKKVSYLYLKPGLGKTIIAAILANVTKSKIFYVCPPFLVNNTDNEFDKWTFEKKLFLIPDSRIANEEILEQIRKKKMMLLEDETAILIIDEAHRFKNEGTKRSEALYDRIAPLFKDDKSKIIAMSGTPMPNSRPIEIWPVLLNLAYSVFNLKFFPFALRYCGAHKDGWGWKFDGFTNKQEFKQRIFKDFMLKMDKTKLQLPEKLEGLLVLGDDMPSVLGKMEQKVLESFDGFDLKKFEIEQLAGKQDLHLQTYLKLLGEYKLKYVLPWIESFLEDTGKPIVLFAEHTEAIEKLTVALKDYDPLVITGAVPVSKRQAIVDEFQNNPERKVFIGNYKACGVGFTLTKAKTAVFVEFSWVDGENEQASDRLHRISQDETVNIFYTVLKNSFDKTRMEIVLNKRKNAI